MAENFEKLECWKKCFELKAFIKEKVLVTLPASENMICTLSYLELQGRLPQIFLKGGEDIIIKKTLSFF